MSRFRIILAGLVAVSSAAVVLAVSSAVLGSDRRVSAEEQARAVASELFQTINDRRYARTCALLSAEYYRRNRVPDRRACALGLRIGFLWSNEIRFRVTGVSVEGDRAVVRALADGIPGSVLLVREGGRFKVLALESG